MDAALREQIIACARIAQETALAYNARSENEDGSRDCGDMDCAAACLHIRDQILALTGRRVTHKLIAEVVGRPMPWSAKPEFIASLPPREE